MAALDIRKELLDSLGLGRSYQNIGLITSAIGEDSVALRYLQQARSIREALKDQVGLIYTLVSMAEVENKLGQIGRARNQLRLALTYAHDLGSEKVIAYVEYHLGEFFLGYEELQQADSYLSRSYQTYLKLEDLNGASQAVLALASLDLKRETYLDAISKVLPQLGTIEDLQAIPLRRDAYEILSIGYAALGQHQAAYRFQSLYIKDDQALRDEEAIRRITLLRGQFDFEAQNKELQILQERSEKNRLRTTSIATSLGVLLLIACLVVVFVLYRSQNRVTHILTAQKQEIETKNRELARTNRELADFAHAASHDLKQPLRTINSYAGLLQRRYASQLDPNGQDFLAYITKGTSNMWTLLNDLLAYARFGRQEEALTELSVEDLLREVTQSLRQQIRESGASFFWSHMPTLLAYHSGLYQLFLNLISNAIKFRGEDPPQIVIGYQDAQHTHLFMIRDNGIGIDPAYQDKVFQAFQRLHEPDKYPGTGLGLAIVLKAVQMHQGKIWIDSIPGEGSTFWVELPKEMNV